MTLAGWPGGEARGPLCVISLGKTRTERLFVGSLQPLSPAVLR